MKEYIITWDNGYGASFEVVEAKDAEEAQNIAYESWKEDAESEANYDVIGEATEKLLKEYDL